MAWQRRKISVMCGCDASIEEAHDLFSGLEADRVRDHAAV